MLTTACHESLFWARQEEEEENDDSDNNSGTDNDKDGSNLVIFIMNCHMKHEDTWQDQKCGWWGERCS
jgi:hypothetical protein